MYTKQFCTIELRDLFLRANIACSFIQNFSLSCICHYRLCSENSININILSKDECIIAPRMTARVALPLMIKPLLYVPAASGSSMLQTTIYALQCALSLRPIRTRHNSTNDRERFQRSLRGEGKWSGDSRGISVRWSGKEPLVCELYSCWNARSICVGILEF